MDQRFAYEIWNTKIAKEDSTLQDISIRKNVQNRAPFVRESRPTDKWDFIKL